MRKILTIITAIVLISGTAYAAWNMCTSWGIRIGGWGVASSSGYVTLSNNYTHNSAGNVVGVRFLAPPGDVHLHYAYFHTWVHSGSTYTSFKSHLTPSGAATSRPYSVPTLTVYATSSGPSGSWIQFDYTSASTVTLTPGQFYWVTCGDEQGGIGPRTTQILTRSNGAYYDQQGTVTHGFQLFTHSTGFSSNGSSVAAPGVAVLVFSDGTVIGNPYDQGFYPGATAAHRGLGVRFAEKIKATGLIFSSTGGEFSRLSMWSGGTGTFDAYWSGFNSGQSYTLSVDEVSLGMVHFPSEVTFEKDTIYRIILDDVGSSTAYPIVSQVTNPNADLLAASYGRGEIFYTIASGGTWSDWNTNAYLRLPAMSLIISDQVAITGGGGGAWGF